jgi:hypothetical protein
VGFTEPRAGCAIGAATLHPAHPDSASAGVAPAVEDNMRAETKSLVEEIKQSMALLRRHL